MSNSKGAYSGVKMISIYIIIFFFCPIFPFSSPLLVRMQEEAYLNTQITIDIGLFELVRTSIQFVVIFLANSLRKAQQLFVQKKFLKGQSQKKKRMIPKNGQTIQHSRQQSCISFYLMWQDFYQINKSNLALCFTSSSLQAPSSNLK